ncbi:hypothetical protein ACOME3_008577 [Neoechinorhynchus agilis]
MSENVRRGSEYELQNDDTSQGREMVNICRRYFQGYSVNVFIFDLCFTLAGLFALPLLWLVNCIWFFPSARMAPAVCSRLTPSQRADIRKYVIRSAIGCVLYTAIFLVWNIVFQLERTKWGLRADQITFVLPIDKL